MRPYKPYIPQTAGEVVELLGSMVLDAPKFEDESYFAGMSIETEYFALDEGLKVIKAKLGEERYTRLVKMALVTKEKFLRAREGDAEELVAGRNILIEMIEMLQKR
ncbi:hypothetical protein MZO42_20035 [Sphingomonas psychrotolerans]|uniref:Uncharacterized protein n=1 Tax=Sphingomonas psychrotolerans TaxID=1327635 RepID=A0ABU3N908_9SPHN|nr:hypothetical protein [Sphingomonas psychrotolerans]MDT8760995.1 hypothetical protein [Sphingomonas psychrotolerans]